MWFRSISSALLMSRFTKYCLFDLDGVTLLVQARDVMVKQQAEHFYFLLYFECQRRHNTLTTFSSLSHFPP